MVAAGNIDLQPGTSERACLCWGHRPRSLVCAAGRKLVRCCLGPLRGPADVRLVHTLREGEQFTQLAQASQVTLYRHPHLVHLSDGLQACCDGRAACLFTADLGVGLSDALAWGLAVLPACVPWDVLWASQVCWQRWLLWWAGCLLVSWTWCDPVRRTDKEACSGGRLLSTAEGYGAAGVLDTHMCMLSHSGLALQGKFCTAHMQDGGQGR